jgi:predicted dinucleotide-binding enzyme
MLQVRTVREREGVAVKIAVIGTGDIGSTLIRRLARTHEVAIANSRGPSTLTELSAETGALAKDISDVAADSDVIILSIPPRAVAELPADLLTAARPKAFVIDTGNYVPHMRDGRIRALDGGMVESRWTQSKVHFPVLKAFNNIKAADLRSLDRVPCTADRIALPVSGDDPAMKLLAIGLVDEVGFDGVDAGGLDESWRQQPGTPVYTTNLDIAGVRRALALAKREQTFAWRERMVGPTQPAQRPSRQRTTHPQG